MGRIAIVYFSGTGNTWATAQQYALSFSELGQQVDLLPVEEVIQDRSIATLAQYDLLGLGYPVHAWNAPRLMDDFMAQLPRVEGQRLFLFVTATGYIGNALVAASDRLTRLGYAVVHEARYFAATNPLPLRKVNGDESGDVAKRLAWSSVDAREAASEILAGNERRAWAGSGARFVFSTVLWRGYLQGCRYVHGLFNADEKCDFCALCVETCPTHNIRLVEGRVIFGSACTLCLRCLHICPVAALQVSRLTQYAGRALVPGYLEAVYRDHQR